MRRWTFILVMAAIACLGQWALACKGQSSKASTDLGIALDYFQSGKYHEALMLLAPLDSLYRLNPRFRAYTGLCYYYNDDFRHAAKLLDEALPLLSAFSPQEKSVYYRACGESHFAMQQYVKAKADYDSLLIMSSDRERADAYYRIGYIYAYACDWANALDNLQSALVHYQRWLPGDMARIAQTKNMIEGCKEKISRRWSATPLPPIPALPAPLSSTIHKTL